jgi:mannose-6-phosphate isomerase-like protein (cupin superfamily)
VGWYSYEIGRGAVNKINLAEKFALFDERWSPKVVGEVDAMAVKLAKLEGAFVWHRHDDADELFLVVKGRLVIELRQGEVTLEEGELFIVPKGVEHKPVASELAHVVLLERTETRNTGNLRNERTVEREERI